jgi:hypothetical protein
MVCERCVEITIDLHTYTVVKTVGCVFLASLRLEFQSLIIQGLARSSLILSSWESSFFCSLSISSHVF